MRVPLLFACALALQWTLGAVLFTEASGDACSAVAEEITVSGVSSAVMVMFVLVAGALAASVGFAISTRRGSTRRGSYTKGISMA